MNPNPSANRDVVELWGREFNLVKNGLSEAQVVSFVNDLAKQHDVLLQRQEHLVTLTKLAERTVSEADKMADEIKQEAQKQARVDAAKIISEAEASAKTQSGRIIKDADAAAKAQTERLIADATAQAEQTIKEKESHAMTAAAEQAEAIISTAEKVAAETKKDTENEIKKMISDAETRSRHIVEQKEAEANAAAAEQARVILENAKMEAGTMLEREKQRIQPELTQFVRNLRSQLMSELDSIKSKVGSLESQFDSFVPSIEAPKVNTESKPSPQKPDAFMDLVKQSEHSDDEGEPTWEVEIVPPLDIMKIMSIVSYLDSLSEVSRTEIIPRNDRTSVIIYTCRDMELVDMIKSLPEITSAEETRNSDPDHARMRKITVALSAKDHNEKAKGKAVHDAAK
jgi:cell division septum initiation protein DivIVA